MLRSVLTVSSSLAAVCVLAACGDDRPARDGAARPPAAVTPPPREVQVLLGNRLRAALRDRAVLEQPPGEAAALGQSLPTALVEDVHCSRACSVRLRTTTGHVQRLRYVTQATAPGCVTATAKPALPPRLDPITRSYAEDPLNVLSAGCGADPAPARPAVARPAGAAGVAAQDPRDALVPRSSAALLRRPIATYRRHVLRELAIATADAVRLRELVRGGNLAGARRAWLRVDEHYERIGAAYGAFGALDRRVDGRPGGLPGGVASDRFTGLHRIELALWGRRSTHDAVRSARRLPADLRRLRRAVADGSATIAPLDYVLRAHEVLEDTLHLGLSGTASPWASAALVAARANLRGTRVVLATLDAPLRARDPQRLAAIDAALARLDRVLHDIVPAGRFPRWNTCSRGERDRVTAAVADAAEQLAFVPALVDPRVPVARANPYGLGGP